MPGPVGGARFLVVVGLAMAVVAGTGCPSKAGNARDLAVSSDRRARAAVDDALRELKAGRLDDVLGRFCDRSEAGAVLARSLLEPVVARGDVAIRRVEPAWVATEPFFFVEVGTADGTWVHGFGVEVRSGCLERAVGAPEAATGSAAPTAGVDAGSLVE